MKKKDDSDLMLLRVVAAKEPDSFFSIGTKIISEYYLTTLAVGHGCRAYE